MTLKESIKYLEEEIEDFREEGGYSLTSYNYEEVLQHVQVLLNEIKKRKSS